MLSREFLYNECELHQKPISVHFYEPKLIDGKEHRFITIMGVEADEKEYQLYTSNILQGIDTYGDIRVRYFAMFGSPFDLKSIIISTDDIAEFDYRK